MEKDTMSLQVFFYVVPEKQELPEVAAEAGCNTESATEVPHKGYSRASNTREEKTCISMLLEGLISTDPSKRLCMTFPVIAKH